MQSKKPQHDIGKTPLAAGSDRLINNAVGKALAKKQICDSILSYLSPPEQVAIMTVNTDVLRSVSSRLHRLVDGDWLRGLYTRERPQSLIQTYLAYTRQISLAYTSPSAHLLPTPLELFEMCPSLDKIHWYNGFIERRGPPGERQYRIDYDIDIMYPNSPNLPAWAPEHEVLSNRTAPPFWFYDHLGLRAGTNAFITRKLNLHMQSIQHVVNWENHLVRVLDGPLTGLTFFYPTISQLRVIVDILARKNLPRAGCLDKDAIIQLYMADWWAVVRSPGWEGVFDDLRKLGLPVRLFVGAKGVSYWDNEALSIAERNTAWAKLLAVSPYIDELHLFEPIDPLAGPPGGGDRWECDDLRYIVNKDRKKVSRIRLIAYCIRYTLDRPDYWEFRGRQQNQVRSGLYPYAEMFEKMSTKNCHVHLQGIVTTQDGWPEDGMDVQPHDWREWDFVMHDSMAAHQQYYDPDSDYLYPVL